MKSNAVAPDENSNFMESGKFDGYDKDTDNIMGIDNQASSSQTKLLQDDLAGNQGDGTSSAIRNVGNET